jgi:alkylation response protein AidB-like acyl-CoA dehydrogenase
VRVPDTARVGEADKGWAVVRFALGIEQAMGFADLQEHFFETVRDWSLEEDEHGERPFDDARVREQLGQTAIHTEVARLLRSRSAWLASEGKDIGAKGAMTKAFSGASYLEDAQAWMQLAGPRAAIGHEQDLTAGHGIFEEAFRQTPVNTIYGGTVEILRSLIAEADLGLPKSR